MAEFGATADLAPDSIDFERVLKALGDRDTDAGTPVDWGELDDNSIVEQVQLSEEQSVQIANFLQSELQRSHDFLRPTHVRFKKFRERYAEYRKDKNFPWENASNIEVSMTAPNTNQIIGQNLLMLRSAPKTVRLRPRAGISSNMLDSDFVAGMEDFINAKTFEDDDFFMDFFQGLMESSVVGSGVLKAHWVHKKRSIKKWDYSNKQGGKIRPRTTEEFLTEFRGNKIDVIQAEDFLLPPESMIDHNAIDNAHWVSQRFRERWGVIEEKMHAGIYTKDATKLFDESDQRDPDEENPFIRNSEQHEYGELQEPEMASASQSTLHEVHMLYPIDEGGPEVECVFVYSYQRNVVISARKLVFFHGRRPFTHMPFFPKPGNFFGRGAVEMMMHSQHGANDIFNSGVDALTLANTGVWASSRESSIKTGKNDRIWAGRWIQLDNPADFKRVDMGQPSPQTMDFVAKVDQMGRRSIGLTARSMGEQQPRSDQTAQGEMLQEAAGSPVSAVTILFIKKAVARITELCLSNYQQFQPRGDDYLQKASNGKFVQKFFKSPPESIVGKYDFVVATSRSAANPEVLKSTLRHLAGVIGPMYERMIETMQKISSPAVPPGAARLMTEDLKTSFKLSKQLVQASDLPGAEDMVPDFETIWPKLQEEIQEAREAAKKRPPKLDETLGRAMAPKYVDLLEPQQIELLKRFGFKLEGGGIGGDQKPPGAMGGRPPGRQGPPPGAPPGMPGGQPPPGPR